MKLKKRKGLGKAAVAVARRLASITHAMWRDGSDYRAKEEPAEAAAAA